jgi:hypothetical protein
MNTNMVFLANHGIDFSGSKRDVLSMVGSRLSCFHCENPQFFNAYKQNASKDCNPLIHRFNDDHWQYADFSLDVLLGKSDPRKVFIFGGPYGFLLRISDPYIEFLAPIYNRHDWYSPDNSRDVAEWRSYFRQITVLLGGKVVLYITTAYFEKYHAFFRDMDTSFTQKLETLKTKHGVINKPFTAYGNGKYPRYFLDNVESY